MALKVSYILRVLSDNITLDLFNKIAIESKINSKQLMNGFTRKPFYSRIQRLIVIGLVKRSLGFLSLTSFGKVIYHCKLKIDAGLREFYNLKAVDTINSSDEMSEDVKQELIKSIVNDEHIKVVLLR